LDIREGAVHSQSGIPIRANSLNNAGAQQANNILKKKKRSKIERFGKKQK